MYFVELISTGTELLSGKTVNTHGVVLGEALRNIGLVLQRDTTIPDDFDTIKNVALKAMERSDIVFVSGGLGPTNDDITRDVFAAMFKDRLVHDPNAMKRIQAYHEANGRVMNDLGARQALVLETAEVLKNGAGAAPGQMLRRDGTLIFLLPGPPSEFQNVLTEQVIPILLDSLDNLAKRPEHIFQVCQGESDIATIIRSCELNDEVDIAYCAAERGVEIRLEADDAGVLRQAVGAIRNALGKNIYAEERMSMGDVVGHLLTQKGKTLATAESCTGGLLGDHITRVPGSSAYYAGGLIAYSNAVKETKLGVQHELLERVGAVSEDVARQMAIGVRKQFNTDYGIGITGVAGPGGGSAEKPVGLVYVAVADDSDCTVQKHQFGSDRTRNKKLAVQMALNQLRWMILER